MTGRHPDQARAAAATRPSRSAGDTAGNASRFARHRDAGHLVEMEQQERRDPDLGGERRRRPPARPARGRKRRTRFADRRGERRPCRRWRPPTAGTRSTRRATDPSTIKTRTADARTEPVARVARSACRRARSSPSRPARITDGSAPVRTTKKTTTPTHSRIAATASGPSARPIPGSAPAPWRRSRPRHDQQVTEPGRVEVPQRGPGRASSRRPAPAPSATRPPSAGTAARSNGRRTRGTACVARMNTLGDGPRRTTSETESVAAMPRRAASLGEPGIVRYADRALRANHDRLGRPRRRIPVAVHPHAARAIAAARPTTRPGSPRRCLTIRTTTRRDPRGGRPSISITRRGGSRASREASMPRVADARPTRLRAPRSDRREQAIGSAPATRPRLGSLATASEAAGSASTRPRTPTAGRRSRRRRVAVRRATHRRARPTRRASPIHGRRPRTGSTSTPAVPAQNAAGGRRCRPAAHRDGRSDRHEVTDLFEGRGSDAAHVLELVHRRERPVSRPGRRRSSPPVPRRCPEVPPARSRSRR